ncbi:hypothetical protein HanXRQr2_Chr03g0107261 [Helianthus annuus]|uniref:Uncharacterized protein n=1 Tax=Helianthus annuus TaxID=4232 RepID=A0A9K3JEK8_HELAN|nr:hypothetical protein HanXRQr2_Chr03g0107261 [Helianthus annuus]KAJ0943407.1 hypothetical protein HanPSC8_Chr03g0103831 [Helianthus annuus]
MCLCLTLNMLHIGRTWALVTLKPTRQLLFINCILRNNENY